MKKLFLYVFLGLLWCNVGVADNLTVKDMTLICDSNERVVLGSNGDMKTDTEQKSYEIYI